MNSSEKNTKTSDLLKNCPVQHTLQFIGGKWKIGILWNLRDKSKRFGELKRDVLGISEKMLIQELRQLQKNNIVKRKEFPQIPPKVEYSLTEKGMSLVPLINEIVLWGYDDMKK
jgi:DNA-binding HxlR family transcriptional regulator